MSKRQVKIVPSNKVNLPQVVEFETVGWCHFWLRAFVSAWHLGVLSLFAPFEPTRYPER
jgi:hypothetical protein